MDNMFNFKNTYTKLPNCFFYNQNTKKVKKPELVIFNKLLSLELNINISSKNKKDLENIFSGNIHDKNITPFAQAYAGHQFGHFTNLGDGRAVILGEHLTSNNKRFDIQFKGSGITPFSRQGDGKAALGPMLREYLISEAMHFLNIPTTRSLAVIKTGENVFREKILPGAILTRVASSHIRVGTFQYAFAQKNFEIYEKLFNYTIDRHYPEISDSQNKPIDFLNAFINKQTDLVTNWMRVGFVHGVMNTDNMTLSGETIDYGPCAFMDTYDPKTVFSSIDQMGRYAYENQPIITQWNIARFAETMLPMISLNAEEAIEIAEDIIKSVPKIYHKKWLQMMRNKLGILEIDRSDEEIIKSLLNWMYKFKADYTNTFLDIMNNEYDKNPIYNSAEFKDWLKKYKKRKEQYKTNELDSMHLMQNNNPKIIPRNHIVEKILIDAGENNYDYLNEFIDVFTSPYEIEARALKYQEVDKNNGRHVTYCGT